jgi:hypothetical protein
VERMEDKGDDWATWQWKRLKLVHAPTFRPRSRRVRHHPVVVAARLAARLALAAARFNQSQSGDQDHWTSCQERGQTSWRHTWQGHRECRIKIPPGSDTDGGGGKATVGTRGDGMEVVHRPTF